MGKRIFTLLFSVAAFNISMTSSPVEQNLKLNSADVDSTLKVAPVRATSLKNANEQLLYFTSTSLLNDDCHLIFISDRTGDPNIFIRDMKTGREHQLSSNKEGYLKSYVYFDGTPYKGFGKASVTVDPLNGLIYYIQGRDIMVVDTSGHQKILAQYPAGQMTAFTHVSSDGSRLCVPTTDARSLDGDNILQGKPEYDIDKRVRDEKLSSYLRVFDTKTGKEILCERVPEVWITHVQFSPADNNLILYNNEWPSDCGVRRIWLWDGKLHHRMREEGDGRSKEDWTCHEMWQRDGKAIIYHGVYKNGPAYLGRIFPDGSGRIEIPLPAGWKRYGHFTEGARDMIVTDGYYTQSDDKQVTKDPGSGLWICILKVDWERSKIKWIPLCRNGSSWHSQDEHPHPIFNHSLTSVFFTSDMEGKRAVFQVEVPLKKLATELIHSPVKVFSANPHYFSYKNKPLVLITSDHHYGAIIDLDFDYVRYLNFLAVNGMNLTRIYPGGMFEPPDKYLPGNPLGPRQGRQLLPWAKSDQPGANPLLAESGKPSFKYDLDKWNPAYFDRLKAFVELAGKKDIIVEIPFFNGMYADCWPLMPMYHSNNIQNIGHYEMNDCGLYTTTNSQNQEIIKYQMAYIRKIVSELNGYDNLIFDICDEPSLQGLPDGSIIVHPDSIITPWINVMKDAFIHAEESLPGKHLLGQTVQNLSPDLSDKQWCMWLPAEYVSPAEKALKIDYSRNKPIVNVETNYFGTSLTKFAYTADAVRLEGWWFMLGGGAGIINLNGEFFHGKESGGVITQTQILPQKKILKDFMDGLDLSGLSRFSAFSIAPAGALSSGMAESGKQYAIYLFHGKPDTEWGSSFVPEPANYNDTLTIQSVPATSYLVEWTDPSSGKLKHTENIKWKGGYLKLVTPSYSLDIVLHLTGY
jgi:oligogalacturonide lyase